MRTGSNPCTRLPFLALGFLALLIPGLAGAVQCPGSMHSAAGTIAIAHSANTVGPADAAIHPGTCSHSAVGTMAPTDCGVRHTHGFIETAAFEARWPSAVARSAAGPYDGCSFMCGATTCFVRAADGLPVELLTFGVQ